MGAYVCLLGIEYLCDSFGRYLFTLHIFISAYTLKEGGGGT